MNVINKMLAVYLFTASIHDQTKSLVMSKFHDAKPVWQEEQAKLMKVCYLNSRGVWYFMLWSWIPSAKLYSDEGGSV